MAEDFELGFEPTFLLYDLYLRKHTNILFKGISLITVLDFEHVIRERCPEINLINTINEHLMLSSSSHDDELAIK